MDDLKKCVICGEVMQRKQYGGKKGNRNETNREYAERQTCSKKCGYEWRNAGAPVVPQERSAIDRFILGGA